MIKIIRTAYIKTLGNVATKVDKWFMFVDNKHIQNFLERVALYIFNFRVKHNIFD